MASWGPAVTASLEAAAANGDPSAEVYRRLFARDPRFEALFVRDVQGQVRGHMLQEALDALLRLADGEPLGRQMLRAEAVNHEGLDVPRDAFPLLYVALAETVRDLAGAAWTAEFAAAWEAAVAEVTALTRA